MLQAAVQGLNVEIRMVDNEYNPWEVMYKSLWYALLLRWVPAFLRFSILLTTLWSLAVRHRHNLLQQLPVVVAVFIQE